MSDLGALPASATMTSQTKQRQEVPAIEVNRNEAVRQQAEKRIAAIRKTALTAKYVAAGAVIKGLVYFRRKKKAPYSIISMPVGDTIFVIHFLHSDTGH